MMNKNDKKKLNTYYRKICKLLVCSFNMKYAFICELKNRIKDIVEEKPEIDYDGIVEILGTPEEIAKSFEDTESLRKLAKRLLICEIVTFCLLVGAIIFIIFQAYHLGGNIDITTK